MNAFSGKKILIADDESALRQILAQEFTAEGAEVLEAENGRAALEVTEKHQISAVVSDIRMPGGDGVELLTRLKGRNATTPVLMLITGFADLPPEDAFDLGAEAYVSKPFDLPQIISTVGRLLNIPIYVEEFIAQQSKISPREVLKLSFPSLVEAREKIKFGRGGFFLASELPLARGSVLDFSFVFSQEDIRLDGTAIVRWTRKPGTKAGRMPGNGFEIINLSESTKNLSRILEKYPPQPYIPK